MLIDLIKTNKDKIFEQKYSQFVIQPSHKCSHLLDAVKVILKFN